MNNEMNDVQKFGTMQNDALYRHYQTNKVNISKINEIHELIKN